MLVLVLYCVVANSFWIRKHYMRGIVVGPLVVVVLLVVFVVVLGVW